MELPTFCHLNRLGFAAMNTSKLIQIFKTGTIMALVYWDAWRHYDDTEKRRSWLMRMNSWDYRGSTHLGKPIKTFLTVTKVLQSQLRLWCFQIKPAMAHRRWVQRRALRQENFVELFWWLHPSFWIEASPHFFLLEKVPQEIQHNYLDSSKP